MKKNTEQNTVTADDMLNLKDLMIAAIHATGQAERVTAMSKELREMCYKPEEIEQIKKDESAKVEELFTAFYGICRKLDLNV